jgi:phosphomannomutase/phosphoglucomutase
VKQIFREYDIRGIFEQELNEQTVKLIGYFLGEQIDGQYVAIGYDARTHSPTLFNYLTSGLNKAGKTVLDMGMVPTPMNYFANYNSFNGLTPSGSIMITGSHNPPEYNGFKITVNKSPFFGDQIYALGDTIMANRDMVIEDSHDVIAIDVKSAYIDYMVDQFSALKSFDQKIVYDCGNGVANIGIEPIFEKLGINAHGLYTEPDGTFPNHHPDPSEEHNLIDVKTELAKGYDLAFAYDGDSDRIALLTQKYNIKGDQMALLFSKGMEKPTVVGEVKCSQVMYDEIERRGGKAIMYKTGHSNLKVKIKETNADLAAEVSGHIFFNDRYFGYDDAIYATLRAMELVHNGTNLDQEIDALPLTYSTEEIKVKTTEDQKFKIIDRLKTLLKNPPASFPAIRNIIDVDGVRVIFDEGWGLVRASNTTPVLVTRFEALTDEKAKLYESQLNQLIQQAKES